MVEPGTGCCEWMFLQLDNTRWRAADRGSLWGFWRYISFRLRVRGALGVGVVALILVADARVAREAAIALPFPLSTWGASCT